MKMRTRARTSPRFDTDEAGVVPDLSRRGLLSVGGIGALALAGLGAGGTTGALWKGVAEPMADKIIAGDLDVVFGKTTAYTHKRWTERKPKPGGGYSSTSQMSMYKTGDRIAESRGYQISSGSAAVAQVSFLTDVDFIIKGDNIQAQIVPSMSIDPGITNQPFVKGSEAESATAAEYAKVFPAPSLVAMLPRLDHLDAFEYYTDVYDSNIVPFTVTKNSYDVKLNVNAKTVDKSKLEKHNLSLSEENILVSKPQTLSVTFYSNVRTQVLSTAGMAAKDMVTWGNAYTLNADMYQVR